MDLAQTLVRTTMRAFYDTKYILVIEALIGHSVLRDDDMAFLMGMNTKDLHKLCGKLREDRYLSVHTRSETKEGQQRPINRTYYFIDYRATIDAIKWRVYSIDKIVQGNTIPRDERKEYKCPRCKAEWTQMEVLDKIDMQRGFLCHRCDAVLEVNTEGDQGGHEQSTRLNKQFRFITEMLPKIDQVVIPENTFETAFSRAKPVVRDQLLNPANETVPVASSENRPTAVKGLANTGPTSISIELTSGEGPSEEEKAAEAAKRKAYLAQNALPEFFTKSTIDGAQFTADAAPASSALPLENTSEDKKGVVVTPSFTGEGAAIDDYFAQLKAEQAREAAKEAEEEDESDDEEDEFEDVVASSAPPTATQSGAVTPASLSVELTSAMKHDLPSSAGSPADTPESGEPKSKRVRIEGPVAEVKKPAEDEEESEEDMEFEDV